MPETHQRGPVVLRRVVVGAMPAMCAWRVVLRPTHCAGSAGLEAFRTLLTIRAMSSVLLGRQRLQSSVLLGLLLLIGASCSDAACLYYANDICILNRD